GVASCCSREARRNGIGQLRSARARLQVHGPRWLSARHLAPFRGDSRDRPSRRPRRLSVRRRRAAVVRARSAGYNRRVRPTLVLLVRHGQTPTTGKVLPGQAPGLHLADKGRRQADTVAQRIASLQTDARKVAAVYASPLERTRETAAPIAK